MYSRNYPRIIKKDDHELNGELVAGYKIWIIRVLVTYEYNFIN